MDDTGQGASIDEADEEQALTPLAPNHVKLLRAQAAIVTAPFVIGSLVLEAADLLPTGAFAVPVLVAAAWAILRVPLRRHAARGYDLGADRLRVVRGLWFRSDTVVPFGRVQHIDVTQGPLERAWGLATLVVHTAGTHNASVSLPGLAQGDAAAMRETIRTHIRREMP
ncbi:PH domain-containing protein [Tsuneonella sp. YG55]|uniref:PH domain-containing protein n=1 Tax=Tsuneonella litorea TaxID=2976475 RepID=A0A9X2W131_9SPHN|nr:PH domain-containing protein [Tsuneonella litorea]MCT2557965.1 PH domain-containing protein [Tsuneonella litorea]